MKKIVLILLLPSFMTSCQFIKNFFKQKEQQAIQQLAEKKERNIKMDYKAIQKDFLNKNKDKDGVKTTSSGLQYKVLKKGSGKSPQATSTVEVHYQGTLIDETEFDSSYKRNQTATFPLNQVIAGWTEGLQLMQEGATYEFYIPSELAYGERDIHVIPANSTLIFKVELIKVH